MQGRWRSLGRGREPCAPRPLAGVLDAGCPGQLRAQVRLLSAPEADAEAADSRRLLTALPAARADPTWHAWAALGRTTLS